MLELGLVDIAWLFALALLGVEATSCGKHISD
jgi:hypothetical protein